MDGILSQEEINALLSGMSADQPAEDTTTSEPLETTTDADGDNLSDVEKDAIGEVANISMGTSATTLYSP